ncbi:MAG: DUF1015 family protein, partial [Chloroflexi bacterium]|nr:DUF1015 family protein [Chloroflexota bacterium]
MSTLLRISDATVVKRMVSELSAKRMLIADGHHRYETGLAYQREQQTSRSACTGREAFNFVLATITDTEDPGLVALPAHRLVRLAEPAWLARLRDQLESLFHVEPLPPAGTDGSERIGIWLGALRGRARHGI